MQGRSVFIVKSNQAAQPSLHDLSGKSFYPAQSSCDRIDRLIAIRNVKPACCRPGVWRCQGSLDARTRCASRHQLTAVPI